MRCSKMNCRGCVPPLPGVVLADDVLRVRPLLVVVEEVLAAQRRDAVRQRVEAQAPDADVDVVDAVVADVAGAVVDGRTATTPWTRLA